MRTYGIVHGLVYGWFNPASLFAHLPNLCDFPCRIIAETQLDEFAFLVQFIARLQRFFVWY